MGNMTCNIIIFVLSTILLSRLAHVLSTDNATSLPSKILLLFLTALPPLLVTYVSDVFPKVVGSLNNTRIAPLIALPVTTLVRLLWPISKAIDVAVMRPVHRLVGQGDTSF